MVHKRRAVTIRGAVPTQGNMVVVLPENGNVHDQHVVAVIRGDEIAGHVPRQLSRILYYFLKDSGEISCVILGRRKHDVGLEVPCVYKICGKSRYRISLIRRPPSNSSPLQIVALSSTD